LDERRGRREDVFACSVRRRIDALPVDGLFDRLTERIRFVLRNFNNAIVGNVTNDVGHLSTLTKATHGTVNVEDLPHLTPGVGVSQGTLAIAATSRDVMCMALVTDAAAATPNGVALRGIRLNPATGSQE
jgi:hypothetical protein